MTQDYLSSDPSGRDTDIPVIKVLIYYLLPYALLVIQSNESNLILRTI